jgi:hypothetical protein
MIDLSSQLCSSDLKNITLEATEKSTNLSLADIEREESEANAKKNKLSNELNEQELMQVFVTLQLC